MKTNSFLGFRKKDASGNTQTFAIYEDCQSDLSEMGVKLLNVYKANSKSELEDLFDTITWVTPDSESPDKLDVFKNRYDKGFLLYLFLQVKSLNTIYKQHEKLLKSFKKDEKVIHSLFEFEEDVGVNKLHLRILKISHLTLYAIPPKMS